MLRTYKYRFYPTTEQQEKIQFTLERCRLLYNRLLEERIQAYKTEGRTLTYGQQANTFSERKLYIPALKEVHSQVLQDVARRLDKTYQSFFRRVKNGEKAGFPRFKSQSRYDSFTYPQSGFFLRETRLELSKIGGVRIKLHRQPQGTMKTCTITVKNGRYYACLSCEVEAEPLAKTNRQVGVDLGIKQLAATSDGQIFEAPNHLRTSEAKIKRQQRAVSRKRRGSGRRRKAIMALARQHERVANRRKDYAHKVSRTLVNSYDLIAFEDLNVQGMVKNHQLAKSIADAGWNGLVQFVMYKAERAGRQVVRVDPSHTSQLCSTCNEIVKKPLAERIHRCPHCGTTLDRDVNAAINILSRAMRQVS
ncbi:IS200/IS605 family element transposase accessory protein TnpB [Paenibacillus mesophilus]|uniref:RNA-guided endonuclease InsQ/TnpB family protein n=1 Tax=Paenibacillus mesophilus TaxID=2582849 RepID=UPI00110E9630|nr:RNA-guided endonuclease TnpB family protein [Paenibacillus mesophilus]TMV51513.1 IS200/IS605 family element transposase accessory protein TnpB [Paenibacillus mesophilus]